jgi:formate dehydrogenase subunit gamma
VRSRHRAWSAEAGDQVLTALPSDERLILPALQALQHEFGHVPPEAVAVVATFLNVSVADTHGVLTFYADLRTTPPAPVTVAVCMAEACQASGSRSLVAHLESHVAPVGARSADGRVDVVEVFCLGNCALGPAVLVNERLVGRVDADVVDRSIAKALAEVPS